MWTDPGWFIYQLEVRICFWSSAAWPPTSCTWAFPLCILVFFIASSLLCFDYIQIKKIRFIPLPLGLFNGFGDHRSHFVIVHRACTIIVHKKPTNVPRAWTPLMVHRSCLHGDFIEPLLSSSLFKTIVDISSEEKTMVLERQKMNNNKLGYLIL